MTPGPRIEPSATLVGGERYCPPPPAPRAAPLPSACFLIPAPHSYFTDNHDQFSAPEYYQFLFLTLCMNPTLHGHSNKIHKQYFSDDATSNMLRMNAQKFRAKVGHSQKTNLPPFLLYREI